MHGLDLTMPRRCARQVHRPNVGGSIEEYYRRTIYVPYMDSLIQSLESRFGESNTPYFRTTSERNAANRKRLIQAHRFICQGNVWH